MDWHTEGADWPNRQASRFVRAGNLTWHVQVMGQGPVILLAHGTGAATHSWRDLLPALAEHFTVVAPDLPGHGFTSAPPSYRMTLHHMAEGLAELIHALDVKPALVVGHSAGAAIVTRLVLDGAADPRLILALNGALLPIPGMHGTFFSGMAKFLAMLPAVPWFFSWRASDHGAVERMIEGTGSRLSPDAVRQYALLFSDPVHVSNVLGMMANWELEEMQAQLPKLATPLVMIVGDADRAVPPKVARKVAALKPGTEIVPQPGLGHLSHEEDAEGTAKLIVSAAKDHGIL